MDTASKQLSEVRTFSYKQIDGCSIQLDVYPPEHGRPLKPVPAVVFFHGGGLSVGNRTSWFPAWLKNRVTAAGMTFMSADYRLIPPSTSHDIVEDIQALFRFLSTDLNALLLQNNSQQPFQVDIDALAVAGASAGGLCAYLAVMHAHPKPKALLALYAMGGDFMIPHYFSPKTEVFFRGREVLDPNDFQEYLHPRSTRLQPISQSMLAYHGPDYRIPGYPANPRLLLPRLYLQLGTWLDSYTGQHEPSLSAQLRGAQTGADLTSLLLDEHRALFPQLYVDMTWPPAFLVHGNKDSAVPVVESQNMERLLKSAGVKVTLKVVDGQEHSFDKAEGAEETFGGLGGLFDEIIAFLAESLRVSNV